MSVLTKITDPAQQAALKASIVPGSATRSGLFGGIAQINLDALKQSNPDLFNQIQSHMATGQATPALGSIAQGIGGQVAQAGMTPSAAPAAATPPAPGAVCPTCGQVMGGAAQTGQAAAAPPPTMPDAGSAQQSSYSPSGESHAYDFSRS